MVATTEAFYSDQGATRSATCRHPGGRHSDAALRRRHAVDPAAQMRYPAGRPVPTSRVARDRALLPGRVRCPCETRVPRDRSCGGVRSVWLTTSRAAGLIRAYWGRSVRLSESQ